MSIMSGYGFFHMTWIGFKQMIMVIVLLIGLALLALKMKKFIICIQDVLDGKRAMNDQDRGKLRVLHIWTDILHLGVFVNVILAVWKP
jgi:hypothetical protein